MPAQPLSCSTAAPRRLLKPVLACRFFQYMTFYMIALQLVQFSLAVVADALPLVSEGILVKGLTSCPSGLPSWPDLGRFWATFSRDMTLLRQA